MSDRDETSLWVRYARGSDWESDHAPADADRRLTRSSRWSPKRYRRFERLDLDLAQTAPTAASSPASAVTDLGAGRRSVRAFATGSATRIGLDELRILLGAVCAREGRYPFPSAGAIYATELYLYPQNVEALEERELAHLIMANGMLEPLWPVPDLLAEAFPTQTWTWGAALTLIVSADMRPYFERYGERGYRFALLEAGALAHQLTVGAAAARLGSCIVGGFVDAVFADALDVDPEAGEQIVACVTVGREASA